MNGRLLVAADAIFKRYSTTETFGSIFDDQWAFQFGTQYMASCRLRLRAGYAFNENPNLATVPGSIGGVIPIGGIPAVQYIQSQIAAISQHRLTGGIGISDITPGVDLDLSLGGMFGSGRNIRQHNSIGGKLLAGVWLHMEMRTQGMLRSGFWLRLRS